MNEQTAQLVEAIKSSPEGTFKLFQATEEEPEVERSIENRVAAGVWQIAEAVL